MEISEFKSMSYGQVHEIRALSSAARATAKALLAHPSLIVGIDNETVKSMSEAAIFQLLKTPPYKQAEIQRQFHPEFDQLIRGEHAEFRPWRVRFWRDYFNVEFFNYADPNTYARGATDLLCTIPYYGFGNSIEYSVDRRTELEEDDVRQIKLSYSQLCRYDGVQGKFTFWVGDWQCNDSFKSANISRKSPVQEPGETPVELPMNE